jgi:hypothetical protein
VMPKEGKRTPEVAPFDFGPCFRVCLADARWRHRRRRALLELPTTRRVRKLHVSDVHARNATRLAEPAWCSSC